jgi:outer membrane protein assembly factor BamB
LEPGWQVAWSAKIEDMYISDPPFVVGNSLVVITRLIANQSQNRVHAYDLHTGEEIWAVLDIGVGSPSPHSQTLRATDTYIASCSRNSTSVLYTNSGEAAFQIDGPWMFSLTLDNERLYLHDYFGNFRAYNLPGGELAWERQLPEAMRGSDLFVTQGRLVASLLTGLWILDAESGQTIAQFPPNSSASTWLYEDTFLVGEKGVGLASLQAVSLETGELVWREQYQPFISYEPPAYSGGILYFPGGDFGLEGAEQILAVALESGDSMWMYQAEEEVGVLSGIAISDGTGYAVFSDGTLRALDLETGGVSVILRSDALYYWATDDASVISVPGVAVADNYVFVSFGCQTVYALRTPEGTGE